MTEQSAVRVRRGRQNANYTAISNKLIDHASLSPEARIALIYLLSKPTDWQLQVADLRRVLGTGIKPCGRNKTYEVLKELKASAYVLAFEETRNGRFFRLTYYVFDEPLTDPAAFIAELRQEAETEKPEPRASAAKTPLPEKRETVTKPYPPLPYPENRHITKDGKKQITDLPLSPNLTSEAQRQVEEVFQKIWDQWPKKERPVSMEAARVYFGRLSSLDRARAAAMVTAYLRNCSSKKARAYLINYLRDRIFEDLSSGPTINAEGQYFITPDRPEWKRWLEALELSISPRARASTEARGSLITKTRWPEGEYLQQAGARW